MTNLTDSPTYDAGVYQLAATDPVEGGAGGIANAAPQNLANRTAYLKAHVDALEAGSLIPPGVAPLAGPVFTGSPEAPTPAAGDNSTNIATTGFVANSEYGVQLVSVAGGANVTLTATQYGAGIVVLTGAITANIAVIFPVSGRWIVANDTSGAFTVTCKTAAGAGVLVGQGLVGAIWADSTNIERQQTDYSGILAELAAGSTVQDAAPGTQQPLPISQADSRYAPFSGQQVFAASGTFTVPAGVTAVDVIVTAGGGGSVGSNTTTNAAPYCSGAGAGAGGTAIRRITGLTPGATVAVTVGSGGTAGTGSTDNVAGAGGSSSFGAYCSATGGGGGTWGGSGSVSAGGTGGTASGGDIDLHGSDGGDGFVAGTLVVPGYGGSSYWAGSVRSGANAGGGTPGANPGAGASGVYLEVGASGGAGAGGIVVVRW